VAHAGKEFAFYPVREFRLLFSFMEGNEIRVLFGDIEEYTFPDDFTAVAFVGPRDALNPSRG